VLTPNAIDSLSCAEACGGMFITAFKAARVPQLLLMTWHTHKPCSSAPRWSLRIQQEVLTWFANQTPLSNGSTSTPLLPPPCSLPTYLNKKMSACIGLRVSSVALSSE
jgi:hypothetical protein